jgi:hypothetical protein
MILITMSNLLIFKTSSEVDFKIPLKYLKLLMINFIDHSYFKSYFFYFIFNTLFLLFLFLFNLIGI